MFWYNSMAHGPLANPANIPPRYLRVPCLWDPRGHASNLRVLEGEGAAGVAVGPARASASCNRRVMRRRGSGENTSRAPPCVPATTHSSALTLSAVIGPRPPSYFTTHCAACGRFQTAIKMLLQFIAHQPNLCHVSTKQSTPPPVCAPFPTFSKPSSI